MQRGLPAELPPSYSQRDASSGIRPLSGKGTDSTYGGGTRERPANAKPGKDAERERTSPGSRARPCIRHRAGSSARPFLKIPALRERAGVHVCVPVPRRAGTLAGVRRGAAGRDTWRCGRASVGRMGSGDAIIMRRAEARYPARVF
ncbi:hypothetical protein BC628DRAFT_143782 [Trametes gibbosa]|nr:hypothetical protein BC628DRAFT_143782 [Trametes gibbosa]